jgi:tetratricopeptide (TPR) repeat protein
MRAGTRLVLMVVALAAASLVIHADGAQRSRSAEIQLQLGRQLFDEGLYRDALTAFQNALPGALPLDAKAARAGVVRTALRVAEYDIARTEAEALLKAAPQDPEAIALNADALWAAGLFPEAEAGYRQALAVSPALPRGHHGLAKSLAAKSQLDEALAEAQSALRSAPRDLELHHTVGAIYERMHRFDEAIGSYTNYMNLLPNRDRSDQATWSRFEIKFLQSFGDREPYQVSPEDETRAHTIDFRLIKDKIVVKARVNGGQPQDFVVDTGSENTVVTIPTAERLGVVPITSTLSAGVGDRGLRGLQLGRIDKLEVGTLTVRNVPCVIKDPPLRRLPVKETESLSPLALGFSATIDYKTRKITMGKHLPEEKAEFELPLRWLRLAMVRGTLDGTHPASFIVDTGGQVVSISTSTAAAIGKGDPLRRIGLNVYGASGRDRDAFLLQGVDLAFDAILFRNFPVVVLNLDSPSALLGFQVGGIVGHKFLSRYRVGFDLERSVLRLTQS